MRIEQEGDHGLDLPPNNHQCIRYSMGTLPPSLVVLVEEQVE